MIDETVDGTFPASDPPAWETLARKQGAWNRSAAMRDQALQDQKGAQRRSDDDGRLRPIDEGEESSAA